MGWPVDMRPSMASSSHSSAAARRQMPICASERVSGPPRSLACADERPAPGRHLGALTGPPATNLYNSHSAILLAHSLLNQRSIFAQRTNSRRPNLIAEPAADQVSRQEPSSGPSAARNFRLDSACAWRRTIPTRTFAGRCFQRWHTSASAGRTAASKIRNFGREGSFCAKLSRDTALRPKLFR